MLCNYVEDHYKHPSIFMSSSFGLNRYDIFQLFLALRANEHFHLGLSDDDSSGAETDKRARYSPYLVCRDVGTTSGHGQHQVTFLSLTKACMLVIKSLSEERDWRVLQLILSKVTP